MATRRVDHTLYELWDIGVDADVANPLVAGVAQQFVTGIEIQRDLTLAYNHADKWLDGLNVAHAIYQEVTNTGGAVVREQDIELSVSVVNDVAHLHVRMINTGAPGSTSRGKLKVYKQHTIGL